MTRPRELCNKAAPPYADVIIQEAFDCRTQPWNAAIFTSKDDNSVGETVSGSTGAPATTFSWNLRFHSSASYNIEVHDIISRFASQALGFNRNAESQAWNIQIVNSDIGILAALGDVTLKNTLIHKTQYAIYAAPLSSGNRAIKAEHVTVNTAEQLLDRPAGIGAWTLNLTNSLYCTVTNDAWDGVVSNAVYEVTPSEFRVVGKGSHYLANGSTYRNLGTTNVSSKMKEILAQTTTYAPIELTADFDVDKTLYPALARDTDVPDPGWHYQPLDYVWSARNLTNSTLTLKNGVCIGFYGNKGLILRTGGKLVSEGRPERLNRIVRYTSVQEQTGLWGSAAVALFEENAASGEMRLSFTQVAVPAGTLTSRTLLSLTTGGLNTIAISHSELDNVYFLQTDNLTSGVVTGWTNNVLSRCNVNWMEGTVYYPFTLYLYNNLVLNGSMVFSASNAPSWTVKDNYFEAETLTRNGASFTADYNGYKSGLSSLGGSNNKTGLTSQFEKGPLGSFYYASSWTNLVDAGSGPASSAGLSHFTVHTNQVKESGTVDIGAHYVTVTPFETEISKGTMTASASSSWDASWIPSKAIDGLLTDPGWHNSSYTEEPSWLRIDLGSSKTLSRLGYIGRVGNGNGVYKDYKFYVTDDSSSTPANWGTEEASGQWTWSSTQERRDVQFAPASGRYVLFRRITADGYRGPSGTDPGYANANEVWIYSFDGWNSDAAKDSDGDGSPDYLEDRNGDGDLDSGETAVNSATDLGLNVYITQPKSNSNIP